MDRTDAFQHDNRRTDLLNNNLYRANYAELDPDVETGGHDREETQFIWTPLHLDDEHFEILIAHRDGATAQDLRLKRIAEKWAFATRVVDKKTKEVLIECRDALFPVTKEWARTLQPCFPLYGARK
jgi:hypothetical protein